MKGSLMKKTITIITCLILLTSHAFAEEIKTNSIIKKVMLYPGSARITRQTTIDLSQGTHKIVFSDIIPTLNQNTITVSAEGSSEALILGANLKHIQAIEEVNQRQQDLLSKIEKINDSLIDEQNILNILEKENKYLESIRLFAGTQIPKDLVTTMPSAENLAATNQFLTNNLTRVLTKTTQTNRKIRSLKKELNRLNREFGQISQNTKKWTQSIIVDVDVKTAGNLTVDVSYLVYNAKWLPRYDARTNLNKNEIELIAFGLVNQNTGEDWKNIKLTLSTAEPTLYGRMPEVSPWIINPIAPRRQRVQKNKTMYARNDMMDGILAFSEKSISEDKELRKTKTAFAGSIKKGLSVIYELPTPATILSDGSENKLPISSQILKATFSYFTYPKAQQLAYLNSKVTNSKDLQLLSGPVNLFLEGDYIGESHLDEVAPLETFDLYLGVDDNVKIKREQLSKKIDDLLIGGIAAPNKKTTVEYKITCENYKDKPITLNILEPMPTSGNDRIKIKTLKNSDKPTTKKWKDKKGVWLYALTLKPKAKKEITYSFVIDHPRDMITNY